MNNLIEFFKNNFHYFLLGILLIVSCVMIGRNMSYDGYKFAHFCQSITGPIQKSWSETMHRFHLGQENEKLTKQNIALLREQKNMYLYKSDTTLTMMSKIDSLHTTSTRMYDYTYAHVIYKTTDQTFNYLILDKGSKDGITRDMAVTSTVGVAGVVSDVSSHFATVISLLHPDSRISAVVMPANQIGTVIWEGNDPQVAYLENIPQHLEINLGDSVMTSGYSNIFPKGILIGTVKAKYNNKKTSFLTIQVKLATNFNKLNTVYIINNLYKLELDSLKANFKNE